MKNQQKIQTSAGQVASIIRQAIISGEIAPGTRIREEKFSKILGVSRSPIREGIRILEAEGLLMIVPNKGAYVIKLNENDLKEIYELRILIELHAIQIACKMMSNKDLVELEALLNEMKKFLELKEYREYLEASHGFHEFYLQRCNNNRLFNLFQILRNNIWLVQILGYSHPESINNSLSEHEIIYIKLREKDCNGAKTVLKKHLEAGYQRSNRLLKDRDVID